MTCNSKFKSAIQRRASRPSISLSELFGEMCRHDSRVTAISVCHFTNSFEVEIDDVVFAVSDDKVYVG